MIAAALRVNAKVSSVMSRAKVAFFASLFAARSDVYAVRWENAGTARSGWMPAVRGGWHKGAAGGREYIPLTEDILASHLLAEIDEGLYPLMDGDRCWWLVPAWLRFL